MGDEGGLPLVAIPDSDIVISPLHIKLGKDLGILKFVDEVRDQGKGVCILNGVAVEILVILTGSEASILFLDEEEGRCLGGLRWADFPGSKVFVNELVHSLSFFYGEGIEFPYLWDKGFI